MNVRGRAWMLAGIAGVMAVSYTDRFILSNLLDPIKADLRLNDTQVGLIAGAAFGLVYSGLAIPLARLSERYDRVTVLSVALAVWSLATASSALAQGFLSFALVRVGVGIGEAAAITPAHTMTADLFPPARRTAAMGVLALAAPLGVLLAPWLAGTLEGRLGWRGTVVCVGGFGLLLAVVLRAAGREPVRGSAEGHAVAVASLPVRAMVRELADRPAFLWLIISLSLMSIGEYAFFMWAPSLLTREFGLSGKAAGQHLLLVQGLPYLAATGLGGLLADWLKRRDERWSAWTPLGAALACLPAALMIGLADTPAPVFLSMTALSLANGLYVAPCYALIQNLSTVATRPFATACVVFAINAIGASIGSFAVGALSDALGHGQYNRALGQAFIAFSPVYLMAAGAFWMIGRTLRAGLDDVRAKQCLVS